MLKRTIKNLLFHLGYRTYAKSLFGFSFEDDLARLLTVKNPVIFDVGANIGQTFLPLIKLYPDARIWCYEPDPRPFAELERAAGKHPQVTCIPAALGSQQGKLPFTYNRNSVTSSLLKPASSVQRLAHGEMFDTVGSLEVEVRTLTAEMARLGLGHIHLLKTDCQGFDFNVLKGAESLLDQQAIDFVLCEALFTSEYDGQGWFHEILPWMSARGYLLSGFYDTVHSPEGHALFANALFRRARD